MVLPTDPRRVLLKIWSDVLNVDAIDIHDGFLSLGGDSLAAMRCINRIITAFEVELPLSLFLLESADIDLIATEIVKIRRDAR